MPVAIMGSDFTFINICEGRRGKRCVIFLKKFLQAALIPSLLVYNLPLSLSLRAKNSWNNAAINSITYTTTSIRDCTTTDDKVTLKNCCTCITYDIATLPYVWNTALHTIVIKLVYKHRQLKKHNVHNGDYLNFHGHCLQNGSLFTRGLLNSSVFNCFLV